MKTESADYSVILSCPCIYDSELKPKVPCEDKQGRPLKLLLLAGWPSCPLWAGPQPRGRLVGTLRRGGSSSTRAGRSRWRLVLRGTGTESLLSMCLLEAHCGFQVIVLDTEKRENKLIRRYGHDMASEAVRHHPSCKHHRFGTRIPSDQPNCVRNDVLFNPFHCSILKTVCKILKGVTGMFQRRHACFKGPLESF